MLNLYGTLDWYDMTSRMKEARVDRGWSQSRLISELQRVAMRRGVTLPGAETMKSRVSRWENGHSRPDDFYRQLLREALELDDRELGFDQSRDDVVLSAAEDLRLHLELGRQVDGELLAALQGQTESVRVQDRQFGAGQLLELMRGHVRNLEAHLSNAVFEGARRPVAAVLADAAALAGWQALDVGSVDQAWRFLATASAAAQQADDAGLYAFTRLQQASVLGELDRAADAADLASAVWESAARRVAPFVRCWLAAATAEMYAGDDRRVRARAQLGIAESMSGALATGGPPCLVFDELHLERWVGHTLVRLRDPAAEPRLTAVAARMDKTFTRASASLTIDLAAALLHRQERGEGLIRLEAGEELARKVGSRRQLRRASHLRLACWRPPPARFRALDGWRAGEARR